MEDETIEVVLLGKPPKPPPLRPIGTEFERKFPPDLTTTDWERSTKCAVYTWRVVAHTLGQRFLGDTVGQLFEEIEVIAMRYEEPEGAGG
jgi:hypothetical protein